MRKMRQSEPRVRGPLDLTLMKNIIKFLLTALITLISSCGTLPQNPKEYRLLVILGVPSEDPAIFSQNETIIDEFIQVGDEIEIGSEKSNAQVSGTFSEVAERQFYFKCDVRVFSTSSYIEENVVLGKPFTPKSGLSGSIRHMFFIKVVEIE